ncbi:MAG TPA: NirA family protein, partial [Xanthobacteraceae bacterium]|nr:NirA family protein [Xanthobacteraceae bacterium]
MSVMTGPGAEFTPEQKRYLEGFASGLQAGRAARGAPAPARPEAEPVGPDAAALKAQDRVLKAGQKLADQEKFKRDEHPFDAYERLKAQAATNEAPKPADNFRWRFFG